MDPILMILLLCIIALLFCILAILLSRM